MPLLLQSSDEKSEELARKTKVGFINKHSKTLSFELRNFIFKYFAFGDFIFIDPNDGKETMRASDLKSFQEVLFRIPDHSLNYHISRNHFSKWFRARALFPLANLIRDLRRDIGSPQLPVVVAALANSDGKMTPNQQLVFDAQMAVGDAEKYPEFDGHVTAIDTRPMCRPQAECPGGRDRYRGHAGSYLEIGDAMARAMLQLAADR